MPTCVKCNAGLKCVCGEPQPVGESVKKCGSPKKGGIWVHVVDDQGKDVPKAGVKKDGGDGKTTNDTGLATYDPLDAKDYEVSLDALGDDLKKDYDTPTTTTHPAVGVSDGAITYVGFVLPRKAILKAKVQSKDGTKQFEKATVKMATGKEKKPDAKTASTGIADFGKVSAGPYTLKAELDAEDAKKFATTKDFTAATEDTDLAAGQEKEVPIPVEPINFVVPKIELEYKVVLLDRKLSDHQESTETKVFAEPTYIQVSVTQSKKDDHPFAKEGKLTASPENVDFFTDEECKTKLDRKLTKEELTAGSPTKIYLRGKAAGKFKVKLELDDPADRFVKRAVADTLEEKTFVEEEMGVVEIKMELHRFEKSDLDGLEVDPDTDPVGTYHTNLKDKALPDQKVLTDEKKVKEGRFLHAQSGDHFGRAKVVVKKLTAGDWPDVPADYAVYIVRTNTSGSVEVFDAEEKGNKKSFPVEIKVSDLKTDDKTFWVEGTTETDKKNDVRVELSLDRDDGGLAKSPKRYADWARFTVVKVKEVKLDYTATTGQPNPWDEGTKRWSINLNSADERAGRKIKLKATLTKKLQGVKVHFMLAPDKDNTKTANWGIDLPGTWKWKDIDAKLKHLDRAGVDDRKKVMHIAADTDADGNATAEVWLSRFGGDKFLPGVYIDQDPHLAKYVHGHTDLEKRKPVQATDSVVVWRTFWYQIVKVEGLNPPGVGTSVAMYERVKATMKDCPDLNVARATVDGFNPQAIYPRYMIEVNGGNADALVVSDSNKAQFFTGFTDEAEKPIKVPILICDAQWDEGGNTTAVTADHVNPAVLPANVQMDKLILDPPLQGGGLYVSGHWIAAEWDPAANGGAGNWVNVRSANFTDADLSVSPTRDNLKKLLLSLPAGVGAITPATKFFIKNLVVKGAKGPYLGEFSRATKRILAVYQTKSALHRADFFNTITHELGHGFQQVPRPGTTPTGIPDHPIQADLGKGNHCRFSTDKCVMYDSGPKAGSLNNFCEKCQPYMIVQDMKKVGS